MAFLRVEKKTSGNYLRTVQAYRQNGRPKQKNQYAVY